MRLLLPTIAILLACGCRPSPPSATPDATPAPAATAAPAVDAPAEKRTPPAAGRDSPAPTGTPEPPTRYKVVGTEPFWAIDVDGRRLRFTTMEDQAGRVLQAERLAYAKGVNYSGKEGVEAFVLDIHRGPCSDGMSDRTYAYAATFDIGTRHYKGCADVP